MKTKVILIAVFCTLTNIVFAQRFDPLDGGYLPKPVPYPYLREADVMWSKTVWRIIDLHEKINLPLYYPTVKIEGRYSLIDLLLYGIKNEGIVAYSPDEDSEFSNPLSWKDVENRFGVTNDTFQIENPETGLVESKIIKNEINTAEVKKIMLKELWYFDKQRSKLEVRIIGLCPIREYEKSQNNEENEEAEFTQKKLFWVDFSSVRFLLASHYVFNQFNDIANISFDNLFFKRRFSSYIYKESNVYNDRTIGEYKTGLDEMLESEKIQNDIFVMEHDLWEH